MLPWEIEKEEELVAPRKREVEKRENSEERAVRDFQIPWFVRGFEINRFGPNSWYPNRPDGLKNSEDVRCTSNDQISEIAVNFYKKITYILPPYYYSECVGSHHAICHSWDEWGFAQRIHQGRGSRLKTHGASKASRTERYPSLFFQSFCSVLGD